MRRPVDIPTVILDARFMKSTAAGSIEGPVAPPPPLVVGHDSSREAQLRTFIYVCRLNHRLAILETGQFSFLVSVTSSPSLFSMISWLRNIKAPNFHHDPQNTVGYSFS